MLLTTYPTTTKTTTMMTVTATGGRKRCLLIFCHAAPFQKYFPSWETQAAPSNRGGRPSGPTSAAMGGSWRGIGAPVGHSLSLGCGPRGGAPAGGPRAAHELGAGADRRSRLRAGRGAAALSPRARGPDARRSDRAPGRLGLAG